MERKTFATSLKSFDDATGKATFLASVFCNVDSGGDVVMPGAFTKALTRRLPKFIADHDWTVRSKLGRITGWRETGDGLELDAQFNLEKQLAREIYSDFKFAPEDQEFSFSYDIASNGAEMKDGIRYLKEFSDVFEAGPVALGMNERTALLAVKSDEKAVDNSPWDGPAAMASCSSAADFRSICAGEKTIGQPDERQHWALPHHKSPGAPPNAAGVRNAESRLPQTQDLKDEAAARAHLDAHMSVISPKGADDADSKEGRRNAATDLELIQQTHDYAGELGSMCKAVVTEEASPIVKPQLLNRTMVQKIHDNMKALGADCTAKGKSTEDPSGGKADEDPTGRIAQLLTAFPD